MAESVTFESQPSGAEGPEDNSQETNNNQETPGETNNSQNDQDRPEWLPEKFSSPEELAQAYKELEKKLGSEESSEDQDTNTGEDNNTQDDAEDSAKKATENAGFDYSEIQNEYVENGELSEETYQKLEQSGITRDIVDSYIANQEAANELLTKEVYETTGGQEEYNKILAWAGQNLSQEEINNFDKTIASGKRDEVVKAVNDLKEKYQETFGKDPSLQKGQSGASQSAPGFRSRQEMIDAMADPRYGTDEAYRQDVERKLANTSFL